MFKMSYVHQVMFVNVTSVAQTWYPNNEVYSPNVGFESKAQDAK